MPGDPLARVLRAADGTAWAREPTDTDALARHRPASTFRALDLREPITAEALGASTLWDVQSQPVACWLAKSRKGGK